MSKLYSNLDIYNSEGEGIWTLDRLYFEHYEVPIKLQAL